MPNGRASAKAWAAACLPRSHRPMRGAEFNRWHEPLPAAALFFEVFPPVAPNPSLLGDADVALLEKLEDRFAIGSRRIDPGNGFAVAKAGGRLLDAIDSREDVVNAE